MQTLSWCQRVVRISSNRESLTAIESTTTTTTMTAYIAFQEAFQEDFKIFRLLPRPGITTHWRHKKRVYFGGLETGLEKAV